MLAFLGELHAQSDPDGYARCVVRTLPWVVGAERVSYNEGHPRRGTVRAVIGPADHRPWLNARHYGEHPMMQHFARTGDGRARRFSDFLSREAFHRTAMYQEYYREVGVEHQVACFIGRPSPCMVGFALSRDRLDFSERDRLVLNLLRPHLASAHDHAGAAARLQAKMTALARSVDAAGAAIVLLAPSGRVQFMTRLARQWLRAYFPRRGRPSSRLPDPVEAWLAGQAAGGLGDVPAPADQLPPPAAPLTVARADRRLTVRLLGGRTDPALLLEESRAGVEPASLAPLGLTPREREVLAWASRGEGLHGIADLTGARPRTVAKHLERIYRKLGVDSRAAAVARAHETATAIRRAPE
jgi:DNA-binding CsgD family transcriptional regulator